VMRNRPRSLMRKLGGGEAEEKEEEEEYNH
jgi:hypothetical protein